jgi:hypothetical protein
MQGAGEVFAYYSAANFVVGVGLNIYYTTVIASFAN